jgi:hypothetical protein
MSTILFRAIIACFFALTMLSLAQPSLAQQKAAPAAPQASVSSQPPAVAAQAPAPTAVVQAAADAAATDTDSSRTLKSTTVALRELSPWSMFLSADILVKAVMIGLAFASLVSWTIFIAKMIGLSLVQHKLRGALAKITDSRSLAEAQFALGAKDSVLSSLLSAAMREARGATVGGNFQRQRHQGTGGVDLCRDRAGGSAPNPAWHGIAGHHRRDITVRRTVRHRVGHHEQFHRHLEIADDKSCCRRTGHRGSIAGHRLRPGRGDSGRHHL